MNLSKMILKYSWFRNTEGIELLTQTPIIKSHYDNYCNSIFQAMNSFSSKQRFAQSGCKYIRIRKSEFVAKTQLLPKIDWNFGFWNIIQN